MIKYYKFKDKCAFKYDTDTGSVRYIVDSEVYNIPESDILEEDLDYADSLCYKYCCIGLLSESSGRYEGKLFTYSLYTKTGEDISCSVYLVKASDLFVFYFIFDDFIFVNNTVFNNIITIDYSIVQFTHSGNTNNFAIKIPCNMVKYIIDLYYKHEFESIMSSFGDFFGKNINKMFRLKVGVIGVDVTEWCYDACV